MLRKIKEKLFLLKPMLVLGGKMILALIKDGVLKIANSIKGILTELSKKILVKELGWIESIAGWLINKADKLMEKLYGDIEDLPDAEGDSVEEELDVVEITEDEGITE